MIYYHPPRRVLVEVAMSFHVRARKKMSMREAHLRIVMEVADSRSILRRDHLLGRGSESLYLLWGVRFGGSDGRWRYHRELAGPRIVCC